MDEQQIRDEVRRIINLGDGTPLAHEIEQAHDEVLLALITHGAGGPHHYEAMQGAASAVLRARSNDALAKTMTRLEKSASKLAKAALYLAGAQILVAVIIAAVQIALSK